MKKRVPRAIKFEEESTLMSNERTLLAYIRTTFSALILGFALIQLSKDSTPLFNVGIATIIGGVIIGIIGVLEFRIHKNRIRKEAEDL